MKSMLNPAATVTRFEEPFLHFVVENAFDEDRLEKVRQSLLRKKFELQNSDLFSFLQCDIEQALDIPLKRFCAFLHSPEFIRGVEKIITTAGSRSQNSAKKTKMPRSLKWTDVSAFIYEKTHYLLPHDDQSGTRRVAYVVNLSTLLPEEGGALGLYESKGKKPSTIVKRIYPSYNTLVLFMVSTISFHEVEEVVGDTQRITITGWLHDQ